MQLIGREEDRRRLGQALRAPEIAAAVLRGPSGSGKTALAEVAIGDILGQGGLAGQGKYAEGPAQDPFGPIMSAMSELVGRALDQLYDPMAGLESLAGVLGPGLAPLTQAGFSVEGLQAPAPETLHGLRETAARVVNAALRLAAWLDGFGIPAVLFIDDWTRASAEAQALITALVRRGADTNLKLLLAGRDDRPLRRMATETCVALFELRGLGPEERLKLLGQVLGDEAHARAVAGWLGTDLPALPFDLVETARLLKPGDGCIALDPDGLRAVERAEPVQAVVRKMRSLSADAGRVALGAAFWGDVAPLVAMAEALDLDLRRAEAAARVLEAAGLLQLEGAQVRFRHDRLRAEILATAGSGEAKTLAALMAERLASARPVPALALRLRLEAGLAGADPERWTGIFAEGAADARARADPAATEFGEAVWLLRTRLAHAPHGLEWDILRQALLSAADRGDADAVDQRGRRLIALAETSAEAAEAYELTIAALKRTGDADRGWAFAREGLRRFGVSLPEKATGAALVASLIRWKVERAIWREGWRSPTSDGPTDPLTQVANVSAYLAFERSPALAALLAIRTSMRVRRKARRSPYWLSVDAFICCMVGDFAEAARLGELSASSEYPGPYRAPTLYRAFYWGVIWRRPQASLRRHCAEIRDLAIAEGDLVTAETAVRNGLVLAWRNLPSLNEFEAELAQAELVLEWLGEPRLQAHARALRQAALWLKTPGGLAQPSPVAVFADPGAPSFLPQLAIELACVTGHWRAVADLCRRLARFRRAFDSHPGGVIWRFHETIARLKTGLKARRSDLAYIRKAARLNPVDHRAKALVVDAELHRAAARPACLRAYAVAVEAASAGPSRLGAALAAELAADAAGEFGEIEEAKRYAAKAQELWRAWGAMAKVRGKAPSASAPDSTAQPVQAAQAQAAAAERADRAKSRFLADVAHELRTPLQGMQGLLDLAAEDSRSVDLTAFRDVFASLKTVVDDLTDYGALSSGEAPLSAAPVDLETLVRSELTVAAGQLAPGELRKAVEMDPGLPPLVETDAARVRQVLRNLLSNAAKYGGGYIGVKLACAPAGDGGLRLTISVEDDGPGLSEAEQVLVFEPFERGARQGDAKGLGLGLALSRRIAERLGGGVRAETRADGGARFVFWFEAKPAQLDTEAAAACAPLNILLADDVQLNRSVVAALLRREGHSVADAEDGADALQRLARRRFDLVILDLAMPKLSGVEVLQWLRSPTGLDDRTMPAIVLTASSSEAVAAEASRAGATLVLRKPLSAAQLRRALAELFPQDPALLPSTDVTFAAELEALARAARRELDQSIGRLLDDGATRSPAERAADAHKVAGLAAQFGWTEIADAADSLEFALLHEPHRADEGGARLRTAALALN